MEEVKCMYYYKDTLLHKGSPCNAKIVRKEPVFSSEEEIDAIFGPRRMSEWRNGEKFVQYYLYECEKGHLSYRPDGWADVPTVPPGTIKSTYGTVNTPWYKKEE
jgi:hypothetical protein